jgi:hypothetical protein
MQHSVKRQFFVEKRQVCDRVAVRSSHESRADNGYIYIFFGLHNFILLK